MFIPTFVFQVWFGGLFSFALIGFGAYLAREWYQRGWVYDQTLERWVHEMPDIGWNEPTALLAGAVALIAWAFLGGLIVRGVMMLIRAISGGSKVAAGQAGKRPDSRRDGEIRRLRRPDGTELQVEFYGPADAPPVVVTHGWGVNSTEFSDLKRLLTDRFRLIAWDLPGMGKSTESEKNDYRLETFAGHLDAVLDLAGRPAVVLGHSIGGMTILTYARTHAAALREKVAGIVLVHTTYKNPVRTTKHAAIFTALEKPLIVPMLHLMIGVWPLVWLMNWMGYLNGSAHNSTKRTSFGGTETPRELDFAARFQTHASPAVLARGMFAMLDYDATATLPTIPVPTLIIPGDRDPVCLPEASEFMARQIPNARLNPLSPARHEGLIEHHERFASLVGEFAASCQRSHSSAGQV